MLTVVGQPPIFEDIAREAISLCRQSLASAAHILSQRNAAENTLDGELFIVRHLLILKEVANNLAIPEKDAQPRTNFSEMTGRSSEI